ncbi:MAG: hypothetical protein JNL10_10325 [Verrucomicrobiales bacterium]|nr:hypothetical protein [Verrucomicrobiales bacterium]
MPDPYPDSPGRSAWILRHRPDLSELRKGLSVDRPGGWMEELEPDEDGKLQRFLTVFLTNRECPWRCLMCDLWRQTTLESVPPGAIPRQIEFALNRVSDAPGLKLYNAGSFFDPGAIPEEDLPRIAELMCARNRLIVECHPKLVGDRVTRFAGALGSVRLEVALGLETAHPVVLDRLNKGMTLHDFSKAAAFLREAGVDVRAFVLVKPPFLGEMDAAHWAVESARFAFDAGATVVSLIPTRLGNGALEALAAEGRFAEPGLGLLEEAMDRVLGLERGRVFFDLWDLERFGRSAPRFTERRERLEAMNRTQRILPRISG